MRQYFSSVKKSILDWMLRHAEAPHAEGFLFLIAFAESSFFPLPPDLLLIAMVILARDKWLRYFLICLAGSVLGGVAGYAIGYGVWEAVHPFFFQHVFPEATFQKAQRLYEQYDFWVVFTAAFTPIPYKVFTITAGVMHLDIPRFVLASIVGRGGRFILVAYSLYLFGPAVKEFLKKHFNWISVVFTILLIGGFYLLKHLH